MRGFFRSIMMDQKQGVVADVFKFFLLCLSFLYGFIIRCRKFLYKVHLFSSYKLSKPVVSVGNLTWGGVGKTPLVMEIARNLVEKNLRPAVLTRGYMADKGKGVHSDEARLIEESLDGVIVLAGKDRLKSALEILKDNKADIFILDDGFQHLRIKRDLDILAIDSTNPFGNGDLLPRGILREPIKALKRADMVVLTKTDFGKDAVDNIKEKIKNLKQDMLIAESVHAPEYLEDIADGNRYNVDFIRGKKVFAFSSIGDPISFRKTISCLGANLVHKFSFDDHHWYTDRDIKKITKFCEEQNIGCIITTAKDAVKLKRYSEKLSSVAQCLVLNIRIDIAEGKNGFFHRISNIV